MATLSVRSSKRKSGLVFILTSLFQTILRQSMTSKETELSLSDIDETVIDLQRYAATYAGHTKLARLSFITDTFTKLKQPAAKLLLQDLKNSSNALMFLKVLQNVDEITRNEVGCDESTAAQINQNNQARMDLLETELSSAKSCVLKEAMRTGYNDIGHLHYQMGNLGEALKSYLRTRDVCTMSRHNCEMCLNVIQVSIDLKQFFNVVNFIGKVTDTLGDELIVAKLKAASALVDLNDQQFKQAAWKFLEVSPSLGNQFNVAVSAEDIGMYASICALATFDRSELRAKLVDNKSFVNTYLSLLPDFKALVMSFYGGQYGTAMKLLAAVRPRLLCDLYLHGSVSTLLNMISERMLLQFFNAYCTVDLNRMAQDLQMNPAVLEQSLVRLISSGKLSARIDAQSGTLHRRSKEVRQTTLEKVTSLSKVHAAAIKRDILRLSLLQQGFVVGDAEEGATGNGGGRATPPMQAQSSYGNGPEDFTSSSAFANAVPMHGAEFEGGGLDEVDMEFYNYDAGALGGHHSVSQPQSQASMGDYLGDMDDDM